MGRGNVWKGLHGTGHPPVLGGVEEGEEDLNFPGIKLNEEILF